MEGKEEKGRFPLYNESNNVCLHLSGLTTNVNFKSTLAMRYSLGNVCILKNRIETVSVQEGRTTL